MRTWKGRVVYNRKPHQFSHRDLLRINERLEEPWYNDDRAWWVAYHMRVILKMTELWDNQAYKAKEILYNQLREELRFYGGAAWEEFGGGSFGGAGATRPWDILTWEPPGQKTPGTVGYGVFGLKGDRKDG